MSMTAANDPDPLRDETDAVFRELVAVFMDSLHIERSNNRRAAVNRHNNMLVLLGKLKTTLVAEREVRHAPRQQHPGA